MGSIESSKIKTMMTHCTAPKHPTEKTKEELYKDTREVGSPEDRATIEIYSKKNFIDMGTEEL